MLWHCMQVIKQGGSKVQLNIHTMSDCKVKEFSSSKKFIFTEIGLPSILLDWVLMHITLDNLLNF